MERGNFSRRGFLARSLTGLTLGAGLPAWFAREVLAQNESQRPNRAAGPNSRLTIGFIGIGSPQSRGLQLLNNARRHNTLQFVACCDVDARHVQNAAQRIGGNPRTFRDYRELLGRDDIDAVIIATPDHWHAQVASAAMEAGKDVYCEKPLTLTLNEGKYLVDVQRRTNKVFQTGSQQRTEYNGRFRLACELVRNGRLGTIRTIRTVIGTNPRGGPFAVRPVPEGLDWNFWLGPTPMVDYVPEKCHYTFRWFYEYSGGKMTDWGAHHNDIAQWALNMDDSGPVLIERVRAEEPSQQPRSYNCHPTFEVRYTYANGTNGSNGTVVRCLSNDNDRRIQGNNGLLFEGDDGKWLYVGRGAIAASDPRIIEEPLPQNATRLETARDHIGNWIECIRTRRAPICNVQVGHRSASVCHLGTIALRLNAGQPLRWDPERQQFVDNERANAMLDRPRRDPWQLRRS